MIGHGLILGGARPLPRRGAPRLAPHPSLDQTPHVSAPSLLEREHELAVIDARLDEAAAGRGGLVLIEGPAGIGKSALERTSREARARTQHRRRRGPGRSSSRRTPSASCASCSSRGCARWQARARGRARRRRRAGRAGRAPRDPRRRGRRLVVRDAARPLLARGRARCRSGRSCSSSTTCHWADEASVRFLLFLANRLDESPVLLLAAQRPEGDALRAAPGRTREPRRALGGRDRAALARRHGRRVEPGFAAAFHAATGGNPLLVRRLAEGCASAACRSRPSGVADRRARVPTSSPVRSARRWRGSGASRSRSRAPSRSSATRRRSPSRARSPGSRRRTPRRPPSSSRAPGSSTTGGRCASSTRSSATRCWRADRGRAGRGCIARRRAGWRSTARRPRGRRATCCTRIPAGTRRWPRRSPARAGARSPPERTGGGAALLARALDEPPADGDRHALLLATRARRARLGRPEALEARPGGLRRGGRRARPRAGGAGRDVGGGPGAEPVALALALVEPAIAGVAGRDRELELKLEASPADAAVPEPRSTWTWIAGSRALRRARGPPAASASCCCTWPSPASERAAAADEIAEPAERAAGNAAATRGDRAEAPWPAFLIGMLFKTDRLDAARRGTGERCAEARAAARRARFAARRLWLAWIALREGEAADAEADARAAYDAAPPAAGSTGSPAPAWPRCSSSAASSTRRRVLDRRHGEDGALGRPQRRAAVLDPLDPARSAGRPTGALADQLEARRRRGGTRSTPTSTAGCGSRACSTPPATRPARRGRRTPRSS